MSATLPVVVEEKDGAFVAAVIGWPTLRATADTKDGAVENLRFELLGRRERGELVFLDVPEPLPPRNYTPEEIEAIDAGMAEVRREQDELDRQMWAEWDRQEAGNDGP